MKTAFDKIVDDLRGKGLDAEEILLELSKMAQENGNTLFATDIPKSVEEKAFSLLGKARIPDHLKGYEYWKVAIVSCKEKENIRMDETYEFVAKICNTTSSKVKRAMAYSTQYAFKKCSEKERKEFFGIVAQRPCNKDLLCFWVKKV